MYKIIIYFFFPFITENVQMGRVQRVEDGWATHTGAKGRFINEPPFFPFCPGQNLPGYIVYRTSIQILEVTSPPAIVRGHTSFKQATHASFLGHKSSLPPTRSSWSRFLLIYHGRDLIGISTDNTCVMFTLSTRNNSCCFFVFFLFPGSNLWSVLDWCQKGSSSQYPTFKLSASFLARSPAYDCERHLGIQIVKVINKQYAIVQTNHSETTYLLKWEILVDKLHLLVEHRFFFLYNCFCTYPK